MSASANRYTCSELGACQSRSTPCADCKAYPFAPGAIERHTCSRTTQRRALLRWLAIVLAFIAACALAGFAAGFIAGVLP